MAFRRYTLLPLDDCRYALQPTIPHLSRSSLHRCLQRHGIPKLADIEGDKPTARNSKLSDRLFPYRHCRSSQGKLHMFVAIDRTSKFAFVELHEKASTAVPYQIHTVLTDNGIQFTTPGAGGSAVPLIKEATANGEIISAPRMIWNTGTTRPKHPWTNGQVERMNRTIKDATVRRYYYDSHDQLRQHLAGFVTSYNFGRRLKALKGPRPYEFICSCWTKEPERFRLDPTHQMPGLNI